MKFHLFYVKHNIVIKAKHVTKHVNRKDIDLPYEKVKL